MMRGKRVVVPGLTHRLQTTAVRFLPATWSRAWPASFRSAPMPEVPLKGGGQRRMASWGPPPAPGAVVREATEEDVPAVVDVYIRAYAQPPWNERHTCEGVRALRWVLSQPAFILVSTDEARAAPAGDRAGQPARLR